MHEKREGQFDVTYPPEPWIAIRYHGDELWSLEHSGDGSLAGNSLFEKDAHRIAACVNFCHGVSNEYLKTHDLLSYLRPHTTATKEGAE